MPAQNVADLAAIHAFRRAVASGGRARQGSALLRERIAPASDDPVHVAAVDANSLRCEVHALSLADPSVAALRVAAHAMDAAADALDEYATALGV